MSSGQDTSYVWVLFSSGLALGVILLSSLFGVRFLSPFRILAEPDVRETWLYLRLPRVLFAFCVGAGLAVVGAGYQALFRNPLASPFSLGVASGASLGAALALALGVERALPGVGPIGCGILGALLTIWFVLLFRSRGGGSDGGGLLLVGVACSLFSGSLITLLQYLSDYSQLFRVTRWMMGGVTTVSYSELLCVGILLIGVATWLFRHSEDLDLLLFGDEVAATKGVNVAHLSRTLFLCTSLLIGVLVALCGVIGFVGILVPAMARLLVGLSHRAVIPLAFVGGGILVVLCDLLGRVVAPPYEIPVGVFTALLGGPAFIVLLIRSPGGAFLSR